MTASELPNVTAWRREEGGTVWLERGHVIAAVERILAERRGPAMIPGYFIARDGAGDVWVWAENGDYPLPIVSMRTFTHRRPDRVLWDTLAAQLEVRDR